MDEGHESFSNPHATPPRTATQNRHQSSLVHVMCMRAISGTPLRVTLHRIPAVQYPRGTSLLLVHLIKYSLSNISYAAKHTWWTLLTLIGAKPSKSGGRTGLLRFHQLISTSWEKISNSNEWGPTLTWKDGLASKLVPTMYRMKSASALNENDPPVSPRSILLASVSSPVNPVGRFFES